ncbi:MAG: DEAD/DEAH box helicase, partial [Bdellovibrio sp.]
MFPEPRPYQAEIIRAIMANGNTMVVLPTGTGKTLIAFYLMKKATKSLMMAPTKPLAEQHYKNFQPYSNSAVLITGEVPPKKRAELYKQSYIFATPQTVWNDITNGRIDLSSFDLIIFDECHRAVGDYAYAKIAREIHNAKIVGLTASPGSKKERIMEVVNNLSINSIELRTEEDLKDYLAAKSFKRVYVSLPPEMLLIRSLLRNLFDEFKARMKKYGIPVPMRKADLIRMGNRIMSLKSASKFTLIPIYVSLLNLQHSLELLETQGINAFLNYATNLVKEGKPSVRSLVTHRDFIRAMREARKALEKGVIHPKMAKLLDLIRTFKGKQIIVFVQYTDQI